MKAAMEMRQDPQDMQGLQDRQDLQDMQDLRDAKKLIAGFIDAQVVRRGLDWRTGEAYRIDLEHFYKWLDGEEARGAGRKAETHKEGQEVKAGQGLGSRLGKKPDAERQASLQTDKAESEEQEQTRQRIPCGLPQDGHGWQEKMEDYLEYLALEKRLRPSTVARKSRVFNYYLSYLVRQGLLLDCGPLKLRRAAGRPRQRDWGVDGPVDVDGLGGVGHTHSVSDAETTDCARDRRIKDDRCDSDKMSKTDVDAFFLALEREYNGLDSDFRKRVCLRDLVMMELLFYHGIEVSELLRLEVSDYDRKTGVLTIRKKRGKASSIYLYSRALRERMERWISEHGEFEKVAEHREVMFLSKLGRPLSMKMVINIFEKYRVMAGIEKEVTPKDLKGCMGEYARELMREWCG